MKRLTAIAIVLLAGCQAPTAVAPTSAAVTDSPTTAATATPTAEPTATPPPPPMDVEVLGIAQAGTELTIRLKNPNADVGLVRSPFEMAILDADGTILAVKGTEGVEGALCCTIYQLPPLAEYAMTQPLFEGQAASVELTVLGDWVTWSDLEPSTVTVSGAAVQPDRGFSGPVVIGRLEIDHAGPLNVYVAALVETPQGIFAATDVVDCVKAGPARAFEVTSFAEARGPYTLLEVQAYATRVGPTSDTVSSDC